MDLLPYLEGKEALLIFGAIKGGKKPGETTRLEGKEIYAQIGAKIFLHQSGLSDLLAISAFQGNALREKKI